MRGATNLQKKIRPVENDSMVKSATPSTRDLREALKKDELTVYYQPIVNARSGEVAVMEALIRWRHPVLGLVPPDAFIPLAEKAGIITRICDFVLKRACEDALNWPEDIRVAINLAPGDLRQADLPGKIRKVLNETGLPSSRLELEISERALLSLDMEAKAQLEALASLGVRLSLDDFGTGFSNLNYLSYFPVTTVKIDKLFSTLALKSPKAQAIFRMMSRLAEELGIELIAEGVESLDQLCLLNRENIFLIQGFLYSKPQPLEDVLPLISSWRGSPGLQMAA